MNRTDLVTVTAANGGLTLTKSVEKKAGPGETLTFVVNYTNNGDDPISSLKIEDNAPKYSYGKLRSPAQQLNRARTGTVISTSPVPWHPWPRAL